MMQVVDTSSSGSCIAALMAPINDKDKDGGTRTIRRSSKLFLPSFEFGVILGIFAVSSLLLFFIYLTMPSADYGFLKFPHNIDEIKIIRDNLTNYTEDYTAQVILGYCAIYIFMQTFMIPGTIFMSLLAGALFGIAKGVVLVVFTATAGASCCFFLSKLVGKPIAISFWPEKLNFFRGEVAKRRKNLLNYMLFLRVTPSLPNLFINVASPIVDVPYHIFFFATLLGLIPNSYVTVRAGLALGELKSLGELYDFKTMVTMFFIGFVSIVPTLVTRHGRKSQN